jgi:hypothetical protein
MNPPYYKRLGEIARKALNAKLQADADNQSIYAATARAVIEEYQRLMREQAGEGMPSVEEITKAFSDAPYPMAESWEAVRNLMLSAFARKLEDGTGAWAAVAAEELTAAKAKLAAAEARLALLEWRPVSVKPTKRDADAAGRITILYSNGATSAWSASWSAEVKFPDGTTHWRPFCPPPAPSAEDVSRAEFERTAIKEGLSLERSTASPHDYAHETTDLPWRIWQAARASKEESK